MRILLINSVCGVRSTGRICTDIAQEYEKQGHEVRIAYGRESVPPKYEKYAVKIGNKNDFRTHVLLSRCLDRHGLGSVRATKRFLQWAQEFNPDILWLHNIHGYYINYPLLFDWIKSRPSMIVKWTLHDCWAYTGHCSYYTHANCQRWKTGCFQCPQLNKYPASFMIDNCRNNYDKKKKSFLGINRMTLITPSQWLSDEVKESFLKDYPVIVRRNCIDLTVFHPTESEFRERYLIQDKKIVLGVACPWDERKGLNDFIRLNSIFSDDYKIVLVGLSPAQIEDLPQGILGLEKTDNAEELAEIYSAADVFVNPTYEDNYPTVNLEALACGTPVITYNVGGSPETIDATCGISIEKGDIKTLCDEIIRICIEKPFSSEDAVNRIKALDKQEQYQIVDDISEVLSNE